LDRLALFVGQNTIICWTKMYYLLDSFIECPTNPILNNGSSFS